MKPHFKLSVQCQLPRHCALWKKLRAAWTRKRSWWDAESLDKGFFNSFVCRTFIQIYFLRFDALKCFYIDRKNWFYDEYHSNVHIKRWGWSCNCHSLFSPMKQSILMYDHQDVMKTFYPGFLLVLPNDLMKQSILRRQKSAHTKLSQSIATIWKISKHWTLIIEHLKLQDIEFEHSLECNGLNISKQISFQTCKLVLLCCNLPEDKYMGAGHFHFLALCSWETDGPCGFSILEITFFTFHLLMKWISLLKETLIIFPCENICGLSV